MAMDDSFRKPGAVPFKWEVRPGVPKTQQQPRVLPPPPSCDIILRPPVQHQHPRTNNHHCSCPRTPTKLRPPPAGFYFQPPLPDYLRTDSFRSAPRTRSERYRFDRSILARPETVASGCFPSPLLTRRKVEKKRMQRLKPKVDPEPDYTSDLETLSRWSVSSRKTLSPFRDSPSSSSFSSYQSSPRPVGDAEWAGFGLF